MWVPFGRARSGREAGAAQAAQTRLGERPDDVFDFVLAVDAVGENLVATLLAVAVVFDVGRNRRLGLAGAHRSLQRIDRCVANRVAIYECGGGGVALANARCRDHAHIFA
jgi:hypothetical protein